MVAWTPLTTLKPLSSVRENKLDSASKAWRARQWSIACQNHSTERLRKGHGHRVVRAEILTQRPNAIQVRFVWMSEEIKRVKIFHGRDRVGCRNSTGSHVPA